MKFSVTFQCQFVEEEAFVGEARGDGVTNGYGPLPNAWKEAFWKESTEMRGSLDNQCCVVGGDFNEIWFVWKRAMLWWIDL